MTRLALAFSLVFCAAGLAQAAPFEVLRITPSTTTIPDYLQECELQVKLPTLMKAAGGTDVEIVDRFGENGRSIDFSITEVHAPGGGLFSGPKWVEVLGTVRENGKTLGSFRGKRYSTAPTGTCQLLERCAQTLATDILEFARNPRMNAEIGDAR